MKGEELFCRGGATSLSELLACLVGSTHWQWATSCGILEAGVVILLRESSIWYTKEMKQVVRNKVGDCEA